MGGGGGIGGGYVAPTFTFTYIAGGNGTVSGVISQSLTAGLNGSPVLATAATGYHFVSWSDGSTDNPRTDLNAHANISVTANFAVGAPPTTTVIIPSAPSTPVIVQQPRQASSSPKRKVTVSKSRSRTVIHITKSPVEPKPSISVDNSNIAIQGLNQGQHLRVTITGIDGKSQVVTPTNNSELNTIINNNPKSDLKIEITPTLNSALKTGAQIGITGAKKRQRVRVSIK